MLELEKEPYSITNEQGAHAILIENPLFDDVVILDLFGLIETTFIFCKGTTHWVAGHGHIVGASKKPGVQSYFEFNSKYTVKVYLDPNPDTWAGIMRDAKRYVGQGNFGIVMRAVYQAKTEGLYPWDCPTLYSRLKYLIECSMMEKASPGGALGAVGIMMDGRCEANKKGRAAGFTIMINGEWLKDGEGIPNFNKLGVTGLIENMAIKPGTDIHIYANDCGLSNESIAEWCRKKAAELRLKEGA